MLTSIQIENFKGIATRQRIDFAPLTLLFGPNSAGKSTILQALLYLHELLERGGADVDRTELGGGAIELGGFERLVHRHDQARAIVLRVEFATPGSLERLGRDLSEFPFPDLDDQVESAWVELTIRVRTTGAFRGPIVDRTTIGIKGSSEALVWIEAGPSLRDLEPLTVRVNCRHPVVTQAPAEVVDAWHRMAIPDLVLDGVREFARKEWGSDYPESAAELAVPGSWLAFSVSRNRLSSLPPIREPLRVLADETDDERSTNDLRTFLEMIILGTTSQLADGLRDAVYVGPLREIPPRGFLYEHAGRTANWADGLAAWELLLSDRVTLVERTNDWLGRLRAGCQVKVQELFNWSAAAEDVSQRHVDETVRRLMLDTGEGTLVLPSEVGAGFSQVIPVVVAALDARAGLLMVEQPEIHIHPAMHFGLGDLFIEAITRERGRRTMLVETHSEHLMLRLLRRIEETHQGAARGASQLAPDQVSVIFVEQINGEVKTTPIRIDETGEFVDRWPHGFFEERANELF